MFRALFVFLLIANLLACPLRCLSCQAGVSVQAEVVQSTCGCCLDLPMQDQSPRDERSPEGGCACHDCICDGATIPDGPEIPKPDSDSYVALASWGIPAECLQTNLTLSQPMTLEKGPPGNLAGRHALIAFQIWLT